MVIKNEAGEFTFTNIGGGIQRLTLLPAQYSGDTAQQLNAQRTQGPIGGLSATPGEIEKLAYTVKEKTDRSITYTAESKGLKITKEWSLFPVPADTKATDGFGYLWDLKVTIQNAGTEKATGTYYLYAGLLGKLHSNDWIQPAATWYADGDAIELNEGEFDSSRFLGLFWQTRDKQSFITKDLKEMSFAGVHNQYYCSLIRPLQVNKKAETSIWTSWRYITFDDPGSR